MENTTNNSDQDKVEYIFRKFFNTCKRYRVVTKAAIQSVLDYPVTSPQKITYQDLENINKKLHVPLTVDSVFVIRRLAAEYDKFITNVEFYNKAQEYEFVGTTYSHKQKRNNL